MFLDSVNTEPVCKLVELWGVVVYPDQATATAESLSIES